MKLSLSMELTSLGAKTVIVLCEKSECARNYFFSLCSSVIKAHSKLKKVECSVKKKKKNC